MLYSNQLEFKAILYKGAVAGIEHQILQLISHYGYVALFIALVLGIVGLPVPDDVLMLFFAGFIVSKGQLNYLVTVLVSITGSLSGMSISYLIGSKFGYPLLHKYGPKIHISLKRLERVERWFVKYGKTVLVFGYFIPGVRHLTAYLCGIANGNITASFITRCMGLLCGC